LATYGSLRRSSVRFDFFRVDLSSGELFRSGVRVPIQDQPLQVLRLFLEAEGKVVTREQLRAALWPQDTFVDFEHGVNTAVKKLRQALEDSAERPKFVETLPKIGYRFLVPVEWGADASGNSPQPRVVPIAPAGITAVPPHATKKVLRGAGWRWGVGLLAVGLLFMTAIGSYVLRPRSQMQPEKLTILPFTTFPGFEIAPSFSPDGNQMVFCWAGYEKEFQFDLYIKQVGQERVMQLTHHPATFLASAWSPDGRFIAFMRSVYADPGASGIYIISPLGGSERKVADFVPLAGWDPIGLSWSADGKWLAFAKVSAPATKAESSPEHFSIHVVNVESTEERTLPDPSPDCAQTWQPAFSTDGKYLASVCVLTGGVAKIYVQTSDGKQGREVAGARSSEGFAGIAWAADNRSLVYSSDQHLWRVPLTGRKPEQLLFAQDVESVAVARTGNRLAYAQVRHPGNIWKLEMASEAKPSGPATKLISSSRGDIGPRISPNGNYIAFQSWRSGSPEIWMCDRDGSNPVQLSSFGGPQIGRPSWSPDGRRVIFDLRISGNAELYAVNVDGGPPKRLPTGTANASNPFWSADGHWIYFNTERPNAIWKAPAEGGAAVRLSEGEGGVSPQESADGTRVLFYKVDGDRTQAWSASVNGGEERVIPGMPGDVGWVAARKRIYFIKRFSPRHFSLNYFDLVTRHVHKIADLRGFFDTGAPTVSPDEHTFFFDGIEHSEADIVVAEGFR
jgi:Tol biopolymer transport system component/DNA-binding winged helix-turn-helix (wHTH) protein